jgi:hypothetical protein
VTTDRFIVGDMTGRSMWPTLQPGDVLIVEREPKQLRFGDIVVFGGVVHRLVWIDPYENLWECGDSPGVLPRKRSKRDVTGRVKAIVREGVFIDMPPRRPPTRVALGLARALLRHWTRR